MAGGSGGLTINTNSSKIPLPISLLYPLLHPRHHSSSSMAIGSLAERKRKVSAHSCSHSPSSSFTTQPFPSFLNHSQQQSLPFLLSLPDLSESWWCSWNSREILSYFCKESSLAILVNKSATRWGPKSAKACLKWRMGMTIGWRGRHKDKLLEATSDLTISHRAVPCSVIQCFQRSITKPKTFSQCNS